MKGGVAEARWFVWPDLVNSGVGACNYGGQRCCGLDLVAYGGLGWWRADARWVLIGGHAHGDKEEVDIFCLIWSFFFNSGCF